MPRASVRSGETAATHPKWDRKRGTPKSQEAERLVEKAHGRYSASGQSEERKKARGSRRRPGND
jgi:hypothetical protein